MNENRQINILNAGFLKSASRITEAPIYHSDEINFSEIAFMGRSNVGKSSLINKLTARKNLAKSSNTPGKTQLINFFDFSLKHEQEIKSFILVDLPGIGYAKVSKSLKQKWEKNLNEFISNRKEIILFVYLVDARHPNLKIDNEVLDFLISILKPHQQILKVFTKIDKLTKTALKNLKEENQNSIFISNSKNIDIDILQEFIFDLK
jgi:GTP-binding protein